MSHGLIVRLTTGVTIIDDVVVEREGGRFSGVPTHSLPTVSGTSGLPA